jgi:hypothetical protein
MLDELLRWNSEGKISNLGNFPVRGLFTPRKNPSNLRIKIIVERPTMVFPFRWVLYLLSVPFSDAKVNITLKRAVPGSGFQVQRLQLFETA